jgi:hypothetical protein
VLRLFGWITLFELMVRILKIMEGGKYVEDRILVGERLYLVPDIPVVTRPAGGEYYGFATGHVNR